MSISTDRRTHRRREKPTHTYMMGPLLCRGNSSKLRNYLLVTLRRRRNGWSERKGEGKERQEYGGGPRFLLITQVFIIMIFSIHRPAPSKHQYLHVSLSFLLPLPLPFKINVLETFTLFEASTESQSMYLCIVKPVAMVVTTGWLNA